MRFFLTVFTTVFLAEVGDKTQLATLLFAAEPGHGKAAVFVGSASALVLASAIGVLAGSFLGRHLGPRFLNWTAGLGFIAVGVWTLVKS